VLFDLDETLYPERRFALSGFSAVAGTIAIDAGVSPQKVFRALAGALRRGERATAFQQLCASLTWPENRVPRLVEIYRRHEPNLRLPALSVRTLTALRPDWRLAIVTNGTPSVQTAKVRALALTGLVDTVIYAFQSGSGRGKPEPEPFVDAARLLGVVPARCVFVGDDPRCDIAGARRVGMKTVRIRRGVHAREILGAHEEADAVVDSLKSLPDLVGELLGERYEHEHCGSCRHV
jgi:putative hydrolase of the HAD superfamily